MYTKILIKPIKHTKCLKKPKLKVSRTFTILFLKINTLYVKICISFENKAKKE